MGIVLAALAFYQQIITTREGRYPDPPIYDPYPHA